MKVSINWTVEERRMVVTAKQFQAHKCSQFYPEWRAISDTTLYTSANTIAFWSRQNCRRITITALSGTKTPVRFKEVDVGLSSGCLRPDRTREVVGVGIAPPHYLRRVSRAQL